jgi:ribose transport system substrate-binding protein
MLNRHRRRTHRRHWLVPASALVAGLAAASVAISGCGSNGASGSGSGAGSGQGTSAVVAAAKQKVAELEDISKVTFPTPPDSFKPGKHKLAIVMAGPIGATKTMADYAAAAAKHLGWDYQIFDGKYSADGQASALNQVLVGGFDALTLTAVDVQGVKSQISALIAKGMPITCEECAQLGPQPFPQIIQVGDNGRGGDLMSWLVIAETNGKGNVAVLSDKAFPIIAVRVKSMIDGLKANCPQCKYKTFETPTSDAGKPGPPAWSAALRADPTVTWGAAPYDGITSSMAATADQLGIKAGVNGYDGIPAVIQEIGKGNTALKATLATPYEYASWAAVDLLARKLAGATPWKADDLPNRLVTHDNWKDFQSGSYVPSGFDLQGTFDKSWGITK